MARDFPDWLNPWAAAEGRRTFEGSVPLKRMKRLGEVLEHSEGEAGFKARFALDEERRAIIDLAVDATVTLMCQASLEPYEQHLERKSRIGVINDEAEMAILPTDYEPVLTDNGRMAMETLVEDELLLALPQVPRNPDLDPVSFEAGDDKAESRDDTSPAAAPEDERINPFAKLREQMEAKTQQED